MRPQRAWPLIKKRLEDEIGAGALRPGDRLPSEPELCRAFDAGRHSVRRALAELAAEGKLRIVHGGGAFVERLTPITYAIRRKTRFHQNLAEQGAAASSEHLDDAVIAAPDEVSAALEIAAHAPVVRAMRRGLADGAPIMLELSFHCAARFPDFAARRRAGEGVSAVYAAHGIDDYTRRRTTLFARCADPQEARLLGQHSGRPVIVVEKLDVSADGAPIGFSQAVWAATRVRFSIGDERDAQPA